MPKDGSPPDKGGSKSYPEVDFKRQKCSNETHASTTGPDARLFAKSDKTEAIPACIGHILMENRNKLAVDSRLTLASGTAEREAALAMLEALPGKTRKTLGADKNFEGFVADCREINVTPHVAQNTYECDTKTGKRAKRESNIGARTTAKKNKNFAEADRIRKELRRPVSYWKIVYPSDSV